MSRHVIILIFIFSLAAFANANSRRKSKKKYCKNISREYYIKKYGKSYITYDNYKKLITSRTLFAKKGQSLFTLLNQDKYSYKDLAKKINYVRRANGLESNTIAKDQLIYLPFCGGSLIGGKVGFKY
jgi:hypothetical protein